MKSADVRPPVHVCVSGFWCKILAVLASLCAASAKQISNGGNQCDEACMIVRIPFDECGSEWSFTSCADRPSECV